MRSVVNCVNCTWEQNWRQDGVGGTKEEGSKPESKSHRNDREGEDRLGIYNLKEHERESKET